MSDIKTLERWLDILFYIQKNPGATSMESVSFFL